MSDDVREADWLRASLRSRREGGVHGAWVSTVSTLVPAVYGARGRILHRARKGHVLHPECASVADVLAEYTTTPDDCWFCLWEGYGWPALERLRARAGFAAPAPGGGDLEDDHRIARPARVPVAEPLAPQVHLEDGDCILFRGPVTAATAFRSEERFQSPTLWWPADRAWCVASELDIYSTYVGAEPDALRALIDHPALEVLECTAEQVIDRGPYAATRTAEP